MCLNRVGLVVAILVAASAVPATPVAAQTTSASVQGTVVDAQKGVLPGVNVTLKSKTQSEVLTAVTDGEGRFVFPIVRPDTYVLTATLQGFKTFEQTNIVVNANDKLSAGTLTLEVGAVTEAVSVSARSIELQSNSGERSFTMENSTLTNIANNGRMMFNFATLVPGALSTQAGAGTELGSVSGFVVNGQRPNSNNMTIDGVANIDTGDNGGNMATTNIDSVAEFKLLTNAYQAEYGRAVGGQLQVVTKSGSNLFHGSGYWYGRRPSWNANYWTNNREGQPAPKNTRDDRGYTIGGPVLKEKLFFFWSQEFQSRFTPPNIRFATVPTALERQGDFSKSVDSSGNPFPYIRDYTTGLPCSATDTSGCFQDGGVVGRIPANRLSPIGLNMLKLFPQATGSFGGGQNFSSQVADEAPRREDLIRLDYQLSNNWHVTGRFMNTKENTLQAYGTTWAGNGSDQLPTPTLFMHPGKNFMMSAQGVLTSTMSFEASVGTAKNSLNYALQLDPLRRSNSGLTSFPYLYPDAVQSDYIPYLQFRGGRTGNAGQYQTDRGPFTNENQTWDVVTNLTKVWGAHTAKAGFYYQHSRKPQSIFYSFNGQVSFTNDSSNPFDTGYSYANAATGVFNTYTQANKFSIPNYVYKNFEWYVQDNWKPNARLTLDYGVRFYTLTPQWDTTLQVSNFLPDKFDKSAAARLYYPVCLTASPCSGNDRRGMDPALVAQGVQPTLANTVEGRFIGRLTPGSNRFNGAFQAGQGISDTVQSGDAFKISPRFGAVYDLSGTGDTIIRGGWGIFFDRPQGNMVFDLGGNAPGVLSSTVQWGRLQDISGGGAASADPFPTLGLNPTAYDFDPPRVQQWNVGVQRKLVYNLVADIAYVGSHSDHQLRQEQINSIPLGAAFLAKNQDPTKAPSTTPGASAIPNDLMRPYSGYNGIRMWDYSGYSNYNALQAGVTRRFDKNYMFSAFYVWSKALTINNDDFTAGWPFTTDDATIRHYDYSYANFDRPHNFVLNAIYRTPHFKEGVTGVVTNDWQISGVYRYTSGRPYGIGYSIPGISSINLTGSDYGARVVVTCNPGSGSSSDPYKQIDTSCFAPPQPGSKGDESARFFLHGPAQNNVDLSLSKQFAVYKGAKFELRLDAFNALNHTQFTGVNATANFASLTDHTITNLPYDATGKLVNKNGFGTINGVNIPRTLQLVTRVTF
jgi:hypothetical protein